VEEPSSLSLPSFFVSDSEISSTNSLNFLQSIWGQRELMSA
jgi:hypothetical protein